MMLILSAIFKVGRFRYHQKATVEVYGCSDDLRRHEGELVKCKYDKFVGVAKLGKLYNHNRWGSFFYLDEEFGFVCGDVEK